MLTSSAGDWHGGCARNSQRHLWRRARRWRQCRHDQPGTPWSVFHGLKDWGRQLGAVSRQPSHVHDIMRCALWAPNAASARNSACHICFAIVMSRVSGLCSVRLGRSAAALVLQASSEHSVCFAVKSSEADAAVACLQHKCAVFLCCLTALFSHPRHLFLGTQHPSQHCRVHSCSHATTVHVQLPTRLPALHDPLQNMKP
jgi:hypothetical protein